MLLDAIKWDKHFLDRMCITRNSVNAIWIIDRWATSRSIIFPLPVYNINKTVSQLLFQKPVVQETPPSFFYPSLNQTYPRNLPFQLASQSLLPRCRTHNKTRQNHANPFFLYFSLIFLIWRLKTMPFNSNWNKLDNRQAPLFLDHIVRNPQTTLRSYFCNLYKSEMFSWFTLLSMSLPLHSFLQCQTIKLTIHMLYTMCYITSICTW